MDKRVFIKNYIARQSYVKDGLVLEIDATSWDEYVWHDLSNFKNDLIVVNELHGTLSGDKIIADGDLWLRTNGRPVVTDSLTLEFAITTNKNQESHVWGGFVVSQRQSPGNGWQQTILTEAKTGFYIKKDNITYSVKHSNDFSFMHQNAATFDSTIGTIINYYKGLQVDSNTYHELINFENRDFLTVGRAAFATGTEFCGELYAIRIYNRVLSPQEIAHNYAIDKRRFNLSDASVGEV